MTLLKWLSIVRILMHLLRSWSTPKHILRPLTILRAPEYIIELLLLIYFPIPVILLRLHIPLTFWHIRIDFVDEHLIRHDDVRGLLDSGGAIHTLWLLVW